MKALLGIAVFLFAQDPAKPPAVAPPPAVSQKEIDAAILKGAEYLKTAPSPGGHLKTNCDELILLTLIHAGVSEKGYKELLDKVVDTKLEHTYKVALLAMCLEELDATKYQGKIAQCAQFLVDNQATNGQWSYGRPTDAVVSVPTPAPPAVASGDKKKPQGGVRDFGGEMKEHKKPKTAIVIKQTRSTGEKGDNSNSQYAALGLRACFDANIKLPDEVLQKARTWWVESQFPDENGAKIDKKAVTTGGGEITYVRGWTYQSPAAEGNQKPYHAMTAGAVGATVIYEYMLGRDWRKDPVTKAGVNWLGVHFSINENYYYMYALERAGMLYNTELFGGHNWYFEGARFLIDHQAADGSWGKRENKDENTWDTCFAVLFLKKATRAIATGDYKK